MDYMFAHVDYRYRLWEIVAFFLVGVSLVYLEAGLIEFLLAIGFGAVVACLLEILTGLRLAHRDSDTLAGHLIHLSIDLRTANDQRGRAYKQREEILKSSHNAYEQRYELLNLLKEQGDEAHKQRERIINQKGMGH